MDSKKNPLLNSIEELIKEYFGIKMLDDDVRSATERLKPLLKIYKVKDVKELFNLAANNPESDVLYRIAEKVTTSYSYFFREKEHFEFFEKKLLSDLVLKLKKHGKKDIRIWSGACSTGEEAYTLAIILREFFKEDYLNWSLGVLATDISLQVLEYGKNGAYEVDRIMYFSPLLIDKYFNRISESQFQVKKELRDDVTFRMFNLKSEKYPFKKPFHFIFLRNVLMYFDEKMQTHLINNTYNSLEEDGYLFVSKTDKLLFALKQFENIAPGIFKRINSK